LAASKKLKTFLLIIIFGVPIAWYLFLQFFGSNKFELPVLRQLDENCASEVPAILILQRAQTATEKNQLNRIEQNPYTTPLIRNGEALVEICSFGTSDVFFVNGEGGVLGEYQYNLEDMDRLITEVELFYTINAKDGAGN